MTLGLLPEPGAIFALPNNFLFPGLGFATAWAYTLGYALDIPDKAVNFAIYMGYWWPDINPAIWMSFFVFPPLIFNYLNARRYGDIDYALTSLKVLTVLIIIIVGFIIVGGGTNTVPLLATNNKTHEPIFCGSNLNQTDCLSPPGFRCTLPNTI